MSLLLINLFLNSLLIRKKCPIKFEKIPEKFKKFGQTSN